VQGLFTLGAITLRHLDLDRVVLGGAVPTGAPLALEAPASMAAEYFTERREVGILNIGESGAITVDETRYAMDGRVISVTRKLLNALKPVRDQIEAGEILDPGDLIAALAEEITEELDPVVADLGDTLDDCEGQIAAHQAFELRRQVNRTRTTAIAYRRFLAPQRSALEKLAALPGDWLREDDRLHLNSAADRAARMAEELEAIRERAALTHETLTDLRAELIDQRSLIIAIAAMVFLPLTFITGLLGMNVDGIPYAHEPWAFDAVLWCRRALARDRLDAAITEIDTWTWLINQYEPAA